MIISPKKINKFVGFIAIQILELLWEHIGIHYLKTNYIWLGML